MVGKGKRVALTPIPAPILAIETVVRKDGSMASKEPSAEADTPYTPTQTSLKAGFRASGADRQRDQETGEADERWSDEDRYTNKSGDPRIGTHGRKYEPGE
jgi:hypothetical protein